MHSLEKYFKFYTIRHQVVKFKTLLGLTKSNFFLAFHLIHNNLVFLYRGAKTVIFVEKLLKNLNDFSLSKQRLLA